MRIHTIRPYGITAQQFFDTLAEEHADLLLDVRLKNTNQLAGFTKKNDLAYFVPKLLDADYEHDTLFAPTPELFGAYIHKTMSWESFSEAYRDEMIARDAVVRFFDRYGGYEVVCLLGAASRERRSHVEVLRRMLEDADCKRTPSR
ncbi:hypothetical protein Corgl_1241 [Coriobacterium glomerans PW2]|uniref:DUF488 domain-containing protein n=2 Tax=Coriobacterium TaxID=33870 RepID=F2N8F9_CORGP|nr:hypothetical protein Corgl_1241 [Coriobacterium glomerans PW2]